MSEELVSIGEAAARLGLAVSTLRYWEERGLIEPTARRGGRRCYGPAQLHRLTLIQLWQDAGQLSLDEIAVVLGGGDGWRAALTERLDAIAAQQAKLAAAANHLAHLLECPSENPAAQCSLLREVTRSRLAGEELPVPFEVLAARSSAERRAAENRA